MSRLCVCACTVSVLFSRSLGRATRTLANPCTVRDKFGLDLVSLAPLFRPQVPSTSHIYRYLFYLTQHAGGPRARLIRLYHISNTTTTTITTSISALHQNRYRMAFLPRHSAPYLRQTTWYAHMQRRVAMWPARSACVHASSVALLCCSCAST